MSLSKGEIRSQRQSAKKKDRMKRHGERGPAISQKERPGTAIFLRALSRNQSHRHTDLGLLTSRSVRQRVFAFKPTSLWYLLWQTCKFI
jgi:hypothetical protein